MGCPFCSQQVVFFCVYAVYFVPRCFVVQLRVSIVPSDSGAVASLAAE